MSYTPLQSITIHVFLNSELQRRKISFELFMLWWECFHCFEEKLAKVAAIWWITRECTALHISFPSFFNPSLTPVAKVVVGIAVSCVVQLICEFWCKHASAESGIMRHVDGILSGTWVGLQPIRRASWCRNTMVFLSWWPWSWRCFHSWNPVIHRQHGINGTVWALIKVCCESEVKQDKTSSRPLSVWLISLPLTQN